MGWRAALLPSFQLVVMASGVEISLASVPKAVVPRLVGLAEPGWPHGWYVLGLRVSL